MTMSAREASLDDRRRLLAERVYVDHDHGFVAFGEMTVEQHEARIEFLKQFGEFDES